LEYRETKELSRSELESSLDERIGSATESVSDGARRNLRRVAEIAFETAQTESGYRLGLYAPQRADTLTARYAYWKTADIPSRIPDLSNKETRQLVVDSWKYEKARELAQKRSLEIAELAKKQPENIPEALSGQTITGSKDSPPLTVRENPKFSWLRISQSIPTMGIGFPMESHLDQIDQAGPEFFKLIFDQLSDGEIGVGLNRPRTTFYVVRVHNRDGSGEDGPHQMEELRQTFLKTRFTSLFPTPYDFQAMQVQRELDGSWGLSFNQRFGINPNDRLMSSRESD
jgi:hypothetical protein